MDSPKKISRLALGTAQFGLTYGVSNRRGLIPKGEVFEILKLAAGSGINTLDTAQAYGASEAVIGEFIKSSGVRFDVITKLRDLAGENTEPGLRESLKKAGISQFYGALLHSYGEHTYARADYAALLKARDAGLVLKTGFSLYQPEQAEKLLADKVHFDLVQVPYSILDRRFERLFPALKQAGVEVHVRSVFLQGLLLMNAASIPETLRKVAPKVEYIRAFASARGRTVPAVCTGFALANQQVDKVVIGVDGLLALKENLDGLAVLRGEELPSLRTALGGLAETEEKLLLPQNWDI